MNMTNSLSPEPEDSAGEADSGTQGNELLSQLTGQRGMDLQSLLAARAAGGQAGGDLGLLGMLAAQGAGGAGDSGDPIQALALRMLEQQMSTSPSEVDDAGPTPEDIELERLEALERRRELLEQQKQQMTDLQQVLKSLYSEAEKLRARSDALAAAIGACYLCFGDDPLCPECAGNGVPGSLKPDIAAFRQYVLPAIQRVRTAQRYQPLYPSTHERKEGNGHRDDPHQSSTEPEL